MAEVTTKTTSTTTKFVTIDLSQNMVWEVDKVELTKKYSYWWSKPQLKQFHQDYQNEAMLEDIKNLVRARIQKDFDNPDVVEEGLEKIMKLEPLDIANFLQAGAKSNAKAKGKTNSNTVPKDSNNNNNNSSSSSNNNSNISNPPKRKAQRVANHQICKLLGTCNCPVKQKIPPKAPWMATTEPDLELDSNDDDDLSSSSSSDDDTGDDNSSSSSSSSSDGDDTDDDDDNNTDKEEYDEEGGESTEIPKIDDNSYSLQEPEFLWEAPVQPSVLYSSVFDNDSDDDDDDETNSLTTSDLDGNDDAIAGKGTQTKTPNAYMDDIDAIRRKFRQGALAVLAMEKLKRMVKTQSEPQQQQEQDQPQATWSSSSWLLDMYTASDDKESDDEKGNEKEETPEIKIDQDQEQCPTTSKHKHTTRSADSGNQDNKSDSDSNSDDNKGDKETPRSTTSEKERRSDNHNVGHNDNIDDDEDDSGNDDNDDNGSSSSRDNDTKEHLFDDAEHCPVCRDLVDPSYQKQRVILLCQTLCKKCFCAHYLDDTDSETETETEAETDTEYPEKTTTARRKKPALRLRKYEHIERNTKRDVRILRSLARDYRKVTGNLTVK